MSRFNEKDNAQAIELVEVIRLMNANGESPATSGNFSLKSTESDTFLISESGIEKSKFEVSNLIRINSEGIIQKEDVLPGRRSSDETLLHLMIYKKFSAGCILHSHGLQSVLFAEKFPGKERASVYGLELLKGFSGIDTHDVTIEIPLYENSQHIDVLSSAIEKDLPSRAHGFILKGHGLYTWGKDVAEAKRHLEVFNYIFDYFIKRGV